MAIEVISSTPKVVTVNSTGTKVVTVNSGRKGDTGNDGDGPPTFADRAAFVAARAGGDPPSDSQYVIILSDSSNDNAPVAGTSLQVEANSGLQKFTEPDQLDEVDAKTLNAPIPYNSRALATAALSGLDGGQRVFIREDETNEDRPAYYTVTGGSLVLYHIGVRNEQVQAVDDKVERVITLDLDSVDALIANQSLSYAAGTDLVQVSVGDVVKAGGFRYKAAPSSASDGLFVETNGGVKLYPQPIWTGADGGIYVAASCGVVADGTTDDAPAANIVINLASYDVNPGSKGCIQWPGGDIYLASPLPCRRRITHLGGGRRKPLYANSTDHNGTRFISDSSDIFNNDFTDDNGNGKVQQVVFENISFWSKSGGGAIFNFNSYTDAFCDHLFWKGCAFRQDNPMQHMIKSPTLGDFFAISITQRCSFFYPEDTTVHMLDFFSDTINNILIDDFDCAKSNKNTSGGVAFLNMDRTSGGFVTGSSITNGILQQTLGGFARIGAPKSFVMENLNIYDAQLSASQPIIHFTASSGGVQPSGATLKSVNLGFGTSSYPDVLYETTQDNTNLHLENCDLGWLDAGGATRGVTAIGVNPVASGGLVDGRIIQLRGDGIRVITSTSVEHVKLDNNGRFELSDGMRLSKQGVEIALTADVSNLNISGTGRVILSSSSNGSYIISGIAAGEDGDEIIIENVSGFAQTLQHNAAGSVSANQMTLRPKADYTLENNWSIVLRYSAGAGKWIRGT